MLKKADAQFIELLKTKCSSFPSVWDAKKSIREMMARDYHWRQMEWIGFYLQLLFILKADDIMTTPGPHFIGGGKGTVEFDGFGGGVPWDFKAHPMFNPKGKSNTKVIGNDSLVIAKAVKKYGWVGMAIACGIAEYNDHDRSFQKWHAELKGESSAYELKNRRRNAPSRLRKTKFEVEEVVLVKITDKTLTKFKTFQEGFRNSNGKPRRKKVLIDLSMLDADEIIGVVKKFR